MLALRRQPLKRNNCFSELKKETVFKQSLFLCINGNKNDNCKLTMLRIVDFFIYIIYLNSKKREGRGISRSPETRTRGNASVFAILSVFPMLFLVITINTYGKFFSREQGGAEIGAVFAIPVLLFVFVFVRYKDSKIEELKQRFDGQLTQEKAQSIFWKVFLLFLLICFLPVFFLLK